MEKKLSIREKMALQLSQNKSFYVEKTRESTKAYEQYLSSDKKDEIDRFIYSKRNSGISTAILYSHVKGFNRHSERLKNLRFNVRLCNSTSFRSIIPFLYSSFNTRATANSCSLWGRG